MLYFRTIELQDDGWLTLDVNRDCLSTLYVECIRFWVFSLVQVFLCFKPQAVAFSPFLHWIISSRPKLSRWPVSDVTPSTSWQLRDVVICRFIQMSPPGVSNFICEIKCKCYSFVRYGETVPIIEYGKATGAVTIDTHCWVIIVVPSHITLHCPNVNYASIFENGPHLFTGRSRDRNVLFFFFLYFTMVVPWFELNVPVLIAISPHRPWQLINVFHLFSVTFQANDASAHSPNISSTLHWVIWHTCWKSS